MYFKINRKKALTLMTGCLLSGVLMLGGCGQSLSGTVGIGGSSTVQPLAEKWAKAFETKNPDVKVTIQGGGSSVGVKGCAQGLFDIGAASREMKSSETDQWPKLVTIHVAADGVAVVINPASNSVTDMTLEEIRTIFAGGSSATWTVINREEGSGTREVFEKAVMSGTEIASNAEFLPSNGAMKQKVANTVNAIGYISLGYVDSSVKALSISDVVCNEANCLNKSYPISRYLNFITNGTPDGLSKQFIEFCLGVEGQKIVGEEGYVAIQ